MSMSGSKKTYGKAICNIVLWIIGINLCVFLLPKLFVFFLPFIIGWIIASLANPIVRFFEEKLKIRRKAGSAFVIVFVLFIVVVAVYLLLDLLIQQLITFLDYLPQLWKTTVLEVSSIGQQLNGILNKLPLDVQNMLFNASDEVTSYVSDWVGNTSSPTFDVIGNVAKQVPTVIVCIIVTLLSSYFFVADKSSVIDLYDRMCPAAIKYRLHLINESLKKAIGGYFKAQFKIEVWIYFLLLVGLLVLKIHFAWLIALGIAILDFLPLFGAGTAMVPWAIVKLFNGDYKMAIGLLITWGLSQLIRQILQPKIVGDSLGIPALPTLFLIYIGYRFAGIGGMIIAMPIGILALNMYKEGVFDTFISSVKILTAGINGFRKIRSEDLQIVEEYNKDVEEMLAKKDSI